MGEPWCQGVMEGDGDREKVTDRRAVLVVKMRFVSVACSYQRTSKLTITDVSSLLCSSVTPTIFLTPIPLLPCLLPLSFSASPSLPPFSPPPRLPMAHLHAAIRACSEGDSDSGGGVKNGSC